MPNVGKIVCVELNYVDHVEEIGATTPTEPVLFLKSSDPVIGPTDSVLSE